VSGSWRPPVEERLIYPVNRRSQASAINQPHALGHNRHRLIPQILCRGTHTSVVFKDRLWILGGHPHGRCSNDVWSSKDAVNWTQVTPRAAWSGRMRHTSVVFDNHIWVIGGRDNDSRYLNDVWRSAGRSGCRYRENVNSRKCSTWNIFESDDFASCCDAPY